jgi:hypothetical protein
MIESPPQRAARGLRAYQGAYQDCLGCLTSLHLSEKASSLHLSEQRRGLRAYQGAYQDCLGFLTSLHLSEKT